MRRILLTWACLLSLAGAGLAQDDPSDGRNAALATVEAMRDGFARVTKLHQDAVDGNDTIRSNCLADVLLELSEVLEIAQQTTTLYLEADVARKPEAGDHLRRISDLARRAEGLEADAESCLGDDAVFTQEPTTTVEGPDLPDDFAGATIDIDFPTFDPPPLASPFL